MTQANSNDPGGESDWSIADTSRRRSKARTIMLAQHATNDMTVKIAVRGNAMADTTPPTVSSATVDGTSLVITFDEDLAAAANLANSAFTVEKTPDGQSEETVSLTSSPSISGATVTLTLANAVVRIRYGHQG